MNRRIFEELCTAKGVKLTEQRWSILKTVVASGDHPDADEIYARVAKVDKNVSVATVYRTLSLLADLEIIERHDFGDGRARYEAAEDHHHHLIDIDTGAVHEFSNDELERLKARIADELGYDMTKCDLKLFGRKKG